MKSRLGQNAFCDLRSGLVLNDSHPEALRRAVLYRMGNARKNRREILRGCFLFGTIMGEKSKSVVETWRVSVSDWFHMDSLHSCSPCRLEPHLQNHDPGLFWAYSAPLLGHHKRKLVG